MVGKNVLSLKKKSDYMLLPNRLLKKVQVFTYGFIDF